MQCGNSPAGIKEGRAADCLQTGQGGSVEAVLELNPKGRAGFCWS